MKAVLVFLGFAVACASAQEQQKPALKIKFGVPLLEKCFMPMPTTRGAAVEKGWEVTPHPEVDMPNIELLCDPEDYVICVYFDKDTENPAGVQIAVPKNDLSEVAFDLKVQGWVEWTPCSECEQYYVQAYYFQSKAFLEKSADERLACYNSSSLIQDKLVLTGFYGQLDEFPADQTELEQSTPFTKQQCIPLMGRHYYYNTTPTSTCTADSLYPWFLLAHSGRIIGTGMMVFGKKADLKNGATDYHEHPNYMAVKLIVNNGPQCIPDLAKDPGVVTTHSYFIEQPQILGCLEN